MTSVHRVRKDRSALEVTREAPEPLALRDLLARWEKSDEQAQQAHVVSEVTRGEPG